MTLKADPPHHPRMPGQESNVAVGSPLALIALFTEIVRERFRAGSGLSWIWYDSPGYSNAEEKATPDAPRRIVIEPAFNENLENRNFRPAIFIDRGSTVSEKIVVNNQAGQHLPSGLKGFYSLASTPISIEVVSGNRAESATVGDIVWFYILAGHEQIRNTFGIHNITNPVLGPTTPFESDKQSWSTTVSFTIETELKWTTRPISPILREIVTRIKDTGSPNLETFLLRKYVP